MANIILIDDQDQGQVLTGVSKLVTRSTDGKVEFSLGGGGAVSGGKTIIYALPGGPGQISAYTEDSSPGDAEYSNNLGTLLDGKLKIETTAVGRDYNADWTLGANSQDVSGYVGSIREGANFNSNTSKAKITNVSGSNFKLTFNWSANSYDKYNDTTTAIGTVAVKKNTALYSDTLEGGFNGILAAGESVIVSITSATVNTNHDCPVMNITLSDFIAENVAHSVKLTASPYGAYTVQTAVNEAVTSSVAEDSAANEEYSNNLGTLCDESVQITTTVDPENAEWEIKESVVKGYVMSSLEPTSTTYTPNTSSAKITNISGKALKLSFSWQTDSIDYQGRPTTAGTVSVKKGATLYSTNSAGKFDDMVADGESVFVYITSATADRLKDWPIENVTLTDFAVVQTGGGIAKTVSKADENGKFTFDNKEYNINEPASLPTFQFQSADGIVVTTTADSNHRFYLWQIEKDGHSEVLIPETVDSSTVIRPEYGTILSPVFVETTELPMFRVGSTNYYYWDDAMQAALKSQSKTVGVYTYALPKTESEAGRYGTYAIADADGAMTYTIPTGVTLSIRNRLTIPSGVVLQAHGSGAWLTVNAKIQVSKT